LWEARQIRSPEVLYSNRENLSQALHAPHFGGAAAIDLRIRIRKAKAAISSSPQVGLSDESRTPSWRQPQRAVATSSRKPRHV
jgi:hypothetical protein